MGRLRTLLPENKNYYEKGGYLAFSIIDNCKYKLRRSVVKCRVSLQSSMRVFAAGNGTLSIDLIALCSKFMVNTPSQTF